VSATAAVLPQKERFSTALKRRFFLRVHMFVIVGGTVAVGLLTTKILLLTHERNLAFRYGLAVIVAFAAFLGFIKLWLGYVGLCLARKGRGSGDGGDWLNVVDFDGDGISTGGGGGAIGGPQFESGGGSSFGGGGASGSWGDPVAAPVRASSSSGGGFNLGDIGCDDDFGIVILVAVLVLAIAFAAFYVIWAAPAILSEAAFQGVLAAALARRAKKLSHGTWEGSVLRATALPFAVVLALAITLGVYAQRRCPSAMRLAEAIRCVR
jgi:hypothetical protein